MTTTGDDVAVRIRVHCDEHCDEKHHDAEANANAARDRLDVLLRALVERYHEGHDRFPWSLCSRSTCRDVAIGLGLRS